MAAVAWVEFKIGEHLLNQFLGILRVSLPAVKPFELLVGVGNELFHRFDLFIGENAIPAGDHGEIFVLFEQIVQRLFPGWQVGVFQERRLSAGDQVAGKQNLLLRQTNPTGTIVRTRAVQQVDIDILPLQTSLLGETECWGCPADTAEAGASLPEITGFLDLGFEDRWTAVKLLVDSFMGDDNTI